MKNINYKSLIETALPLKESKIKCMSNWLTIHEELRTANFTEVQSMLAYELLSNQRSQVINRLAARFISLAREELYRSLKARNITKEKAN